VGSSNIDPFSLLLSREANLIIHDRVFTSQLKASLESVLQRGAHQIDRRDWHRTPWYARFASWIAYGAVRLLMGIGGYAQIYDGIAKNELRRKRTRF
jgi:cardiolipin synthase